MIISNFQKGGGHMSIQDLYCICLIIHTLLGIYKEYIQIQKEKTLAATSVNEEKKQIVKKIKLFQRW